jgi:hypothetical protein
MTMIAYPTRAHSYLLKLVCGTKLVKTICFGLSGLVKTQEYVRPSDPPTRSQWNPTPEQWGGGPRNMPMILV